jgi:hypothetical protein
MTSIVHSAEDLEIGPVESVAGWFVGAGLADADGDGRTELVVASQPRGSSTDGVVCATRIELRDPRTLTVRSASSVMAVLGAASLARLDDRPGADLAAVVEAPCGDAADRLERGDLLAHRLMDGAPITDFPSTPLTFPDSTVPPVLVALDDDGPADLIGPGDPVQSVLGVGLPRDGGVWVIGLNGFTPHLPSKPFDLVIGRLSLDAGGVFERVVAVDVSPDLRVWSDAHVGDGWRAHGPAGFIGDVDADGCPELVVPLVTIPCATSADAVPQAGPSWIGTRPFGVVEGRQRRLLVASSVAWSVPGSGLLPPNPVGTSALLGGWRTTGSVPFAIGELRAQDLLYFPRFPDPTPTVDPSTGRDQPDAVVAGRAGERILARVEPIDPATVSAEADAPTLTEFLRSAPAGPIGREPVLLRTPVRPGGLSGVDDVAHHVPLELPGAMFEETAWRVTAVTVNDWGEIAGPVQGGIVLDVVGPALVLEPPTISLPWPLTAALQGTTESQAEVEVVGGGSLEADRRGRFEIRLSLAPWPQDVTIRATDAEGNRTTRTVSLIGGVDVRQLPWQGFVVAAALAAVLFAAKRDASRSAHGPAGPRTGVRGPDRRGLAIDAEWLDDPVPTIEELDPAAPT